MQRNTFIFTAVLAVIAALVVGVNIGKSMRYAPTPSIPIIVSPTATPASTLVSYTNERCGITFMHPSNLQRLESTASGTILTDPKNQEDSIIIVCQKIFRVCPCPRIIWNNSLSLVLLEALVSQPPSITTHQKRWDKDR